MIAVPSGLIRFAGIMLFGNGIGVPENCEPG